MKPEKPKDEQITQQQYDEDVLNLQIEIDTIANAPGLTNPRLYALQNQMAALKRTWERQQKTKDK